MYVRLYFFLLILLIMTLASLLHPLPVVNSDVSQMKYPYLLTSKYKEKEDRSHNARFKRQETDESSESKRNKQHTLGNVEKQTKKGNGRNKRLETDEEGSVMGRNQFYKPISEDTKEVHPIISSKQAKEGKLDHKMTNDFLGPAKLAIAKVARSQRKVTGPSGEVMGLQPDNAGSLIYKSQGSEGLKGNSIDGEHMRTLNSVQRIGRDNSEMQELAETNHLSSEALETIRKINPLTIGDQVSQMIHERNCNPKNKPMSKSTFVSGSASLQNEDQAGLLQDNDDVSRLPPAYVKQQTQNIVQKPCSSKDYGFSVIILAGDPLKIDGSGAGNESVEEKNRNFKNKQKSNGACPNTGQFIDTIKPDNNNMDSFNANPTNKEFRVEKNSNANVEFPVYDQDLTSVPDPFQGILEQNYWANPVRKEGNTLLLGGAQPVPRHRIQSREAQKKNSKNSGKNSLNNSGNKNGVRSGSDEEVSAGKNSQTPDIEPFGDLKIDINKTSCMSWNDDLNSDDTGCAYDTTTTQTTAESFSICSGDTQTSVEEPCGDCMSWREPNQNNNDTVVMNNKATFEKSMDNTKK